MSNRVRTFLRQPGFPVAGSMETDCALLFKKIIITRKKNELNEKMFECFFNLSGAEARGGVVSADERR